MTQPAWFKAMLNLPPLPKETCPTCKGGLYWDRSGEWVCWACEPRPAGLQVRVTAISEPDGPKLGTGPISGLMPWRNGKNSTG